MNVENLSTSGLYLQNSEIAPNTIDNAVTLELYLCNVGPKEDDVELYFKNDTAGANYYLVDYKIITSEN